MCASCGEIVLSCLFVSIGLYKFYKLEVSDVFVERIKEVHPIPKHARWINFAQNVFKS
uniref:Uncharacterized protein n=1 Tax=Meloidogyne enterolobii TaxID=390850 RepID=A0A6V7YD78_MELEN|nr:unnamed protein product [Meloidogyne enterolobii]